LTSVVDYYNGPWRLGPDFWADGVKSWENGRSEDREEYVVTPLFLCLRLCPLLARQVLLVFEGKKDDEVF